MLTPRQTAEIRRVEDRLLSPCCYTQPVSQHMSDVAAQMRGEITAMVVAGQDEEEIVGHYKAQYGERILVIPDGKTGTALFEMPAAICLLAVFPTFLMFRKFLSPGRATGEYEISRIPPQRYEVLRREIERATGDSDA